VNGFLKDDVTVDLDALHAYLAPLAEPSRVETFKFTREWLREEASRVTDMRSAAISRRLNLPPSYVLIHRVSTAGIGVLCQLECEGQFRAEVIKWMPGYTDPLDPVPDQDVRPADDLNGATGDLDGATGDLDGTVPRLNGATGDLDGPATPLGQDDPDDARADAASPPG
jgi:hypothetical protein